MPLTITFDHEQTRLSRSRVWITGNGSLLRGTVDGGTYSSTGFLPIVNTLILEPYFFHDDWTTSSAGNYAKLDAASLTFTTPAKWEARQDQASAGYWHGLIDTTESDSFITNTTWSKNRGFILAWFAYGAGSGKGVTHRCGWGNTVNASSGVVVEFYADLTCQVYKDGEVVGETISLSASDRPGGGPSGQQFVEVLLLPGRHRELIIVTSNGSGGAVEFLDIAADAASPTITGATKFWVDGVGGGQFQLAAVKFATSGYAHTQQLSFQQAPATGSTLENYAQAAWPGGTAAYQCWGHPSYVGTQTIDVDVYETDSATVFVPDDTIKNARLRVTLGTNDSGYTPFIYGALASYEPATAVTNSSEEFNGTGSVLSAVLSVPDDPGGVRLDLTIRDPIGLEADVAAFRTMSNRPIAADIATGVRVLDGRGSPPKEDISTYDETGRAYLEVRDAYKALEHYYFRDPFPLDGYLFTEAVELLASIACPATVTITTDAYVMAPDPMPDADEWAEVIEMGETAASALERLMSKYAANWIFGFRPTAAGLDFYALSPTDLGTTEVLTIYASTADAVADAALDPADVADYGIRTFSLSSNEPEATEVRVTGQEPRSGRTFQTFKVDYTAEDVTLAPSARPANWVGEKRPYGAAFPELHTQAETSRACTTLFDKLTVEEVLGGFHSDLLTYPVGDPNEGFPLWRGANIRLYGYGIYQIIAFGGDFVIEADAVTFRNFEYTVRKVANEPP